MSTEIFRSTLYFRLVALVFLAVALAGLVGSTLTPYQRGAAWGDDAVVVRDR